MVMASCSAEEYLAKIRGSVVAVRIPVAGVSQYDIMNGRKVVPGGLSVHAIPKGHYDRFPVRTHFRESWDYATAWCGATVKVTLPMLFDGEAPGACPACARAVASGAPEPDQDAWMDTKPERPRKRVEKVFLAFEHYDEKLLQRPAGTEIERTFERSLPADPGLRHAVSVFLNYPRQDRFLAAGFAVQAWCGTLCFVLTANGWYEDDRTACPRCVAAWKSGIRTAPARYQG